MSPSSVLKLADTGAQIELRAVSRRQRCELIEPLGVDQITL